MIENQFLHYETQDAFEADKENIADTSIVFVKEDRKIYTHGEQYGGNVVNEFGNSSEIGVSLKTITEAFDAIWNKLYEITGENEGGITMTIIPLYHFGSTTYTAHVTAIAELNKFEDITLYVNNNIVKHGKDSNLFEWDIELTGTCVIKCKAKIFGKEYIVEKTIYSGFAFFIGAGKVYTDIIDDQHLVKNQNVRNSYDVTFEEGDHLYIVLEDDIRNSFIRADMNGFEIPFNEQSVEIEGVPCTVFESVNTYQEGTNNIDING